MIKLSGIIKTQLQLIGNFSFGFSFLTSFFHYFTPLTFGILILTDNIKILNMSRQVKEWSERQQFLFFSLFILKPNLASWEMVLGKEELWLLVTENASEQRMGFPILWISGPVSLQIRENSGLSIFPPLQICGSFDFHYCLSVLLAGGFWFSVAVWIVLLANNCLAMKTESLRLLFCVLCLMAVVVSIEV